MGYWHIFHNTLRIGYGYVLFLLFVVDLPHHPDCFCCLRLFLPVPHCIFVLVTSELTGSWAACHLQYGETSHQEGRFEALQHFWFVVPLHGIYISEIWSVRFSLTGDRVWGQCKFIVFAYRQLFSSSWAAGTTFASRRVFVTMHV